MSGRTRPLRDFGGDAERGQRHAEGNKPSPEFLRRTKAHVSINENKHHLGHEITQSKAIDSNAAQESILIALETQGDCIKRERQCGSDAE